MKADDSSGWSFSGDGLKLSIYVLFSLKSGSI